MPTSKSKRQGGLGKGFDALLPKNFDESILLGAADKIEKVSINRLVPNRYQPRTEFDDQALQQLAASIKSYGVLQPIVASANRAKDGKEGEAGYMIIAGERRWRASKLAGLETVPVIVRTAEDLAQLEMALIENVQRVDLSPLETAASIEYLHSQLGTSYDAISERLGKAKSTIMNIVRLLGLPDRAAQNLREGLISEGHARAILALKPFPGKQDVLLDNILRHNWTVRQAEQFVIGIKQTGANSDETSSKEHMRTETPATKLLAKRLTAPVFIRRTAKGGKIEVSFKTDAELDAILTTLNK